MWTTEILKEMFVQIFASYHVLKYKNFIRRAPKAQPHTPIKESFHVLQSKGEALNKKQKETNSIYVFSCCYCNGKVFKMAAF